MPWVEEHVSRPPWCLSCHPTVSRAVTQWPSTKQCGLVPFYFSLCPVSFGATDELILQNFPSGWFSSRDLGETLRYGNASGSAKCQHRVSTSLLLEELLVREGDV